MMNDCLGSGEDLDLSVWMDQEILKSLGDAQEKRSYSLSAKLRRKIWARDKRTEILSIKMIPEAMVVDEPS